MSLIFISISCRVHVTFNLNEAKNTKRTEFCCKESTLMSNYIYTWYLSLESLDYEKLYMLFSGIIFYVNIKMYPK